MLEVTDDEGSVQLTINIRYSVIVAELDSHIRNMPHSTSLVLCETWASIQDRGGHTPLSQTRQGIFMHLNLFYTSSFGGLNPTPKYV